MTQTSFAPQFPVGYPGMPADLSPKYDRSYFNTALDVAGVVTVTVATFTANTEYSLTINGVVVTTTTPATGGSSATLRDALVAAVNQSFAGVDAAPAAGNTFTVTGVLGQPLTVTPGSSALTQAVTTPVAASGEIGLGLAVVRIATDSDREVRLGAPDSSHRFVGVTVDDGFRTNAAPYGNSNHVYRRGDTMLVRESGTLWVAIEGPPVTPDSPVFYRYSGAGQIGSFRGATATGADLQLTNARFLTGGTDLAQLLLGYATISSGTTV
ncbi:hypothetical protein [Microcoleus sp. Pol12B5]|uniref:hypothetical protein n=1 Tax=Microcoleus sp. Pol12B5 TaxID=3055396 RepID=UPI002FCF196C